MDRSRLRPVRHHRGVVLKLDPRFALLWRTPASVQFGVDAPPVVLRELSDAGDRMLAALASGVSRSGLSMIGTDAGADEPEVERLLAAVAPVLLHDDAVAPPKRTVELSGTGRTADGIASILGASGIAVHTDGRAAAHTDLAIIVAQFVIEPELHGSWLRRDVPHLAVVFGDKTVRIGPVVEPGATPCLYCLERQRTDADPAWPAIESQLWGRRSAAETELVSSEVVAIVTRYAVSRLGGDQRDHLLIPPATSLELEIATGRITRWQWRAHPECACLALPESDWGDVLPVLNRLPIPSPTTGVAAAVPA
jgi:bacteriocin biosynthesis cyclodehydratase domain-containing protein